MINQHLINDYIKPFVAVVSVKLCQIISVSTPTLPNTMDISDCIVHHGAAVAQILGAIYLIIKIGQELKLIKK